MTTQGSHRLPDTTHVGTVRLQVSDLERSLAYYEQVLGLAVVSRGYGEAGLAGQGGVEPIVVLHEKPGVAPAPRRGRLGLYHFAILVPDRAALGGFLAHLAAHGIHPGMADHLVSEALYLYDPDGLGIEVYADRPREQWPYRDGRLMMASDPLDIEGLLVDATAPWTGMPAGTGMGHVHLSVDDLGSAERFYQRDLGLAVTTRDYPGALFLSAGGYHHHLGTNTWSRGVQAAGPGDARLMEWELRLPDSAGVDAAAAVLAAAGHAVTEHDGAVVVTDPWGVDVRLRSPAG